MPNLNRFITVQSRDFERALREVKRGKKVSHWMWYIFPQLKGLGMSSMADYYGLSGTKEAKEYFADPKLRRNLIEISTALLELDENDPVAIFGHTDAMKLRSSMTLFAATSDCPIFKKVLEKYYAGEPDVRTLELLDKEE